MAGRGLLRRACSHGRRQGHLIVRSLGPGARRPEAVPHATNRRLADPEESGRVFLGERASPQRGDGFDRALIAAGAAGSRRLPTWAAGPNVVKRQGRTSDACPNPELPYRANVLPRDPELLGHRGQRRSGRSREQGADRGHLHGGEARLVMALSRARAPLPIQLGAAIGGSADEQVRGVHAPSIRTPVDHLETSRDRSMFKLPREA